MFRRLEPRSLGDHSLHSALPEDTDVACSGRVGDLAFPQQTLTRFGTGPWFSEPSPQTCSIR